MEENGNEDGRERCRGGFLHCVSRRGVYGHCHHRLDVQLVNGGFQVAANSRPGHVSAQTGGETFFYPNFHAQRDSTKLALEVKHSLTRETGYQALMKVRCSNGLQVAAYHGNFVQHNFNADLEFGVIDADKAVGVMFSYDGKLDAKLDAHFQCALLYTTANGERRVRCTNTVASVSEGAVESMRYIDQDAVVTMIAKEGKQDLFPLPSTSTLTSRIF